MYTIISLTLRYQQILEEVLPMKAGPSGRAVQSVGLKPLAC